MHITYIATVNHTIPTPTNVVAHDAFELKTVYNVNVN